MEGHIYLWVQAWRSKEEHKEKRVLGKHLSFPRLNTSHHLPFPLVVSTPHVLATLHSVLPHPFGEAAGGMRGGSLWSPPAAPRFLLISPGPAWAPPWAAVPFGEYLPR